jgi:hypothetical protein
MTLSYERFSRAPGSMYYQSVAGYQVPPRPQGQIEFEKTMRLASFCLARHDDGARLQWFAKIAVEKQDTRRWRLTEARNPGSLVFFEVRVGDGLNGSAMCPPIEYRATQQSAEYFEVEVATPGVEGQGSLLHRTVVFADLYLYGVGKVVRQRKLVRTDESVSIWEYDDRGRIVKQSEEPNGGFSPTELELIGIPASVTTV